MSRVQRSIAGHGSGPVDEFRSRVEAYVAEGMSRERATSRVVSEDPALHAAMLKASNPGREHLIDDRTMRNASRRPDAASQGRACTGTRKQWADPVAAFDERVQAHVDAGMTRMAATKRVCLDEPALHSAYLRAKNPGREHLVPDYR